MSGSHDTLSSVIWAKNFENGLQKFVSGRLFLESDKNQIPVLEVSFNHNYLSSGWFGLIFTYDQVHDLLLTIHESHDHYWGVTVLVLDDNV